VVFAQVVCPRNLSVNGGYVPLVGRAKDAEWAGHARCRTVPDAMDSMWPSSPSSVMLRADNGRVLSASLQPAAGMLASQARPSSTHPQPRA
jgi:hypothetical protein